MVRVVIHSNPHLANQIESAEWLRQGFDKHGIKADVTADCYRKADVHVIQGPHYAYRHWIGKPRVLFLNRCFYGDERFDLSIGWLKPDGSRDFCVWDADEPNGELPELKPMKTERKGAVIFADYGKVTQAQHWEVDARVKYQPVHLRKHPAETDTYFYTLQEMWDRCDVAIGGSSTALVDAAINGLHIECYDPLNVVNGCEDREQWLTDLSWCQWHYTQITSGDFWNHLCT